MHSGFIEQVNRSGINHALHYNREKNLADSFSQVGTSYVYTEKTLLLIIGQNNEPQIIVRASGAKNIL